MCHAACCVLHDAGTEQSSRLEVHQFSRLVGFDLHDMERKRAEGTCAHFQSESQLIEFPSGIGYQPGRKHPDRIWCEVLVREDKMIEI